MKDDDRTPVLIALDRVWSGCKIEHCDLCSRQVYEDPENVRVVRERHGFIICAPCALDLKAKHPEFPALAGQLWEGKRRDPVPADAEMRELLRRLREP